MLDSTISSEQELSGSRENMEGGLLPIADLALPNWYPISCLGLSMGQNLILQPGLHISRSSE